MHLLTLIKRCLAVRLLADPDRADRNKPNQSTARTNAAEASATLRRRRRDHDDVEAYLEAQRPFAAATPQTDPGGHEAEEVL